ncbi:MAG: class I SAM-dependent methyltransferase [Gemmatimonadaceae bacterium]|nr:class I SAM-dependent methyltransferase [Gloeobacterales cyanobacterium ES-bin-141]
MSQAPASIGSVPDTSFLMAVFRAVESSRPDALFKDPFAELLAGDRGYELQQSQPGGGKRGSLSYTVRTVVLDEMIAEAVTDGYDSVLSLGAGLDARPFRLVLPPDLLWVEADLAPVIAYKQGMLARYRPNCHLESYAVDVGDAKARQKLLDRVVSSSGRALVLTEGLLAYLDADQVSHLAQELAARRTFQRWLTDLATPYAQKAMQKKIERLQDVGGSWLKFAPPEGVAFFADSGWRETEFCSLLEEGLRRKRTPMPRLFGTLLKRIASPTGWRTLCRMAGGVHVLSRA